MPPEISDLLQDTSAEPIFAVPDDIVVSSAPSNQGNDTGINISLEKADEEITGRVVSGIHKAFDPVEAGITKYGPSLGQIYHTLRVIEKHADQIKHNVDLAEPAKKLNALLDGKAQVEKLFELCATEIRVALHRCISSGDAPWHVCHVLQGLNPRHDIFGQIFTADLRRQTRDALESFPSDRLPVWTSCRYPNRDPVITVNIMRCLAELDSLAAPPGRPPTFAPQAAPVSPYGAE